MQTLARALGFLYLASGAVLLVSPEASRQLVHYRAEALHSLAEWSAEYAKLSSGALRLLGVSLMLVGATLVSLAARPAPERAGAGAEARPS